jgi:hypothetical protein
MEVKQKASIHNRFDIEVRDAITGKLKQSLFAENIILDQMYTRLCARSSYFNNIHYGTGTGTLSASRTSLFTHLGSKTAEDVEIVKALPVSTYKRKIVLNPGDNVGAILTEVGISFDANTGSLITHAMLRDMNGNIITLTKTALDVITIYATIYIKLTVSNSAMKLVTPSANQLLAYLVGTGSLSTLKFHVGENPYIGDDNNSFPLHSSASLFSTTGLSLTSDVPNKKFTTNLKRLEISEGNGNIAEIGFGERIGDGAPSGIWRMSFPATGIYAGLDLSGVTVATGDGIVSEFTLPSRNIDLSTLVVKKDGSTVSDYTKALFKGALNFTVGIPEIPYASDLVNYYITTDGEYLLVLSSYSSTTYHRLYKNVGGAFLLWQVFTPFSGLGGGDCSMSANGESVAWSIGSAPWFKSYRGSNGVLTGLTSPADITSVPTNMAFSQDGTVLAMLFASDTKVRVYDLVNSNWVLRASTGITTDTIYHVSLAGDGLTLMVRCATSILVYTWNPGTSTWVQKGSTITGVYAWNSCAMKPGHNGAMTKLVFSTAANTAKVYSWSGSDWVVFQTITRTQISNEYFVKVSFDYDGNYLRLGLSNGYYYNYLYELIGGTTYTLYLTSSNSSGPAYSWAQYFHPYLWPKSDTFSSFYDISAKTPKITFTTPPGLVTAEAVGTGDGADATWNLLHAPITGSLVVKLDGTPTTDYTLNGVEITFNTAPGVSVVITADYRYAALLTADYTVKGIHKTTTRVIDIQASITFGEYTP